MHRFFFLAAALLAVSAAFADKQFDYLEAALSTQNTDWDGYGDSTAGTVKGGLEFLDYLHVRGRHHDGNVKLPNGLQQETWTAYGLGLHYPLSGRTSVFIGADHNEVEMKNDRPSERGWYYHIGVRHDVTENWQLSLEAGEIDLIFRDATFEVNTVYSLFETVGLSATLRDYNDLDLTEYELGLRWFFR